MNQQPVRYLDITTVASLDDGSLGALGVSRSLIAVAPEDRINFLLQPHRPTQSYRVTIELERQKTKLEFLKRWDLVVPNDQALIDSLFKVFTEFNESTGPVTLKISNNTASLSEPTTTTPSKPADIAQSLSTYLNTILGQDGKALNYLLDEKVDYQPKDSDPSLVAHLDQQEVLEGPEERPIYDLGMLDVLNGFLVHMGSQHLLVGVEEHDGYVCRFDTENLEKFITY